ncbi:hypothetical protein [Chromobacterium subtsugae]|uniref:hypothetical protein n=1 Tax=Chromobacterium subtsugae TaxID=251747 RepID=UPI000AD1892E|nr:hypothetical protein [Chromobacterium subtsugae]
MAFYLQDQAIQFITIDEDAISQIQGVFQRRLDILSRELTNEKIHLTYIIRFDGKGYKLFDPIELKQYFREARSIERIVFTIESQLALDSARKVGTYLELYLNSNNANNSGLIASSHDHTEWAENSFNGASILLRKFRNLNYIIHNPLSGLVIRLASLFILFAISILLTAKIPLNPHLENGKLFSFLLIFLTFSNIYTYINKQGHWLISQQFPIIKFLNNKQKTIHWLAQAAIWTSLAWIVKEFINLAMSYQSILFIVK